MNDLEKYFRNNRGRLIHKWNHYFDIYERHLSRFREKEIVILEIGVYQGGSLQMWKNYFGPKAKIYGVDIDPRCKQFEENNITILIGSQEDKNFLSELKSIVPKVDILIDDGGHTMNQQIVSFQELYDHVKDDGIYLCEDCHTSYWSKYGGGFGKAGTFIEYSKNIIDKLNAFHSQTEELRVDNLALTLQSIHYYDSIVVFEKGKREKPFTEMSGTPSW